MNGSKSLFRLSSAVAVLFVCLSLGLASAAQATEEINALVWCDHTDPALISAFEEANDVRVNLKEYEGTGTALSLLEQSRPGDWDVLIIDGVDVPLAVSAGLLEPLPKDKLPLDDFFPQMLLPDFLNKDGNIYAVSEKFGYNTITYNSKKVDPKDMEDMSIIWSDKYKNRIAVYDYYLPVIGMVALGLGLEVDKITEADLPAIKEKLFAMKDVTKTIGEVVASQTALATGEVDILVGGGEWVTAVLSSEQPELSWVLPKQGSVRWSQAVSVLASSKKKDLALKFLQYIVSPEGQARLATSSCYWGMPANKKAGALLNKQQKEALRWDQQEEYLARAVMYPSPSPELDKKFQDIWTEFLQH